MSNWPSSMDLFDAFSINSQDQLQPMATIPNAMEKRPQKLRRSCETCRNSKARCCPGKEGDDCQRCAKEGKPCVFLEPKPRPKRAKNSKLRVAEMEEKLESLAALLANVQGKVVDVAVSGVPLSETVTTSSGYPSSIDTLTDSPPSLDNYPVFQFPDIHSTQSLGLDAVPFCGSMVAFPDVSIDPIRDPVSKGIISFSKAEEFVDVFRNRSFPWVRLPKQTSLETLRRERPFLLLSVLTFAAHGDVQLQRQLEVDLKDSLMKKLVSHGEKSLDLLQGLLVYLAWYHYYFQPVQEQMYQLCQMAATMMVDLGINKKNPAPNSIETVGPILQPSFQPPSTISDSLERRRTYLACYYIIASTCQNLRKPANVRWTEYTEECCQEITHYTEYDSDYLIPYFVRLQKFAGDVNRAFDYDEESDLPELDTYRIEMLAQGFNAQLNRLRQTFPVEVWENTSIKTTYYSQRIYVNEIGFHAKKTTWDSMSEAASNPPWYLATVRNDFLLRAMHAAKDYLDRFLGLSKPQLNDLIVSDWIRLIYAVLVLGAFAGQLDAPTLDLTYARGIADVQEYLRALITKLGGVAPSSSETEENPYLSHVTGLFYYYYHHYQSRFEIAQSYAASGKVQAGVPDFSFTEVLQIKVKKCADWEEDPMQIVPLQSFPHDWDQILESWPDTLDPSAITIESSAW